MTGHHVGRVGELVLFDPARGRHEADGVVQRIPGFGQTVEPIIMDKLTIDSWPKFAHPYPLSEKYFLVSCKPRPDDLWGIYLVDVFDNLVLLKEREGRALFEPAYFELRRLVRVGGLESDLHVLKPCEFHADTTELVQMLEKGHHGVVLDPESWDRLVTWIDLNAPCHGTWRDILGLERMREDHGRRRELRNLYAKIDDDLEALAELSTKERQTVSPQPVSRAVVQRVECSDWPFSAAEARHRQSRVGQSLAGGPIERTIDLSGGVSVELNLIPAGQFVMGDASGDPDEQPLGRVEIAEPFWMGRFEVTNEQYARFDPSHDSRHEHGTASFNSLKAIGPPLNGPKQPVVRVSWKEAMAFCGWLSERTEMHVTLPTEAQWEYACRAGTAGAFYYGDLLADFSQAANMADATINTWATYNERRRSADQIPRDDRFDDHALVTVDVGGYRPNPWGLCDMHGNVWEWTRSTYEPYPYRGDDGRNASAGTGRKVVRGGSWYDRPRRCRSAFRLSYPAWQRVYNVGFRVVCEVSPSARAARPSRWDPR